MATDVKLFLSSLRAGRSLLSIPNDLSGCDCAEGSRVREAYPPQTTFYPCRCLPTEHLIRHALVAPRERRRAALQARSAMRTPSPPERPTPAQSHRSVWVLEMHGSFEGSAVRQDPCLDKPPQGNEQLARQRDNPYPAQAATPVAKLLIPLRAHFSG